MDIVQAEVSDVKQIMNLFIKTYGSDYPFRYVGISGVIETLAGNGTQGYTGDGGPAIEAQLNNPEGVAIDAGGNIYIADRENYVIRKVDVNGIISAVAGNGTFDYSGDCGRGQGGEGGGGSDRGEVASAAAAPAGNFSQTLQNSLILWGPGK